MEQKRDITWEHVYAHQGHHDNELSDQAADWGSKGKASVMSRRWAEPPPEINRASHEEMDMCKKCGKEFPVRNINWHMRRCTVTEWVIPKGKKSAGNVESYAITGSVTKRSAKGANYSTEPTGNAERSSCFRHRECYAGLWATTR